MNEIEAKLWASIYATTLAILANDREYAGDGSDRAKANANDAVNLLRRGEAKALRDRVSSEVWVNESRSTFSRIVTFAVPGPPVPWQRASRGNGRTFTAPETRRYQAALRFAFAVAAASLPQPWDATGAYSVGIDVTFPDARRRDIDNVSKSVLDALNGAAWNDDSQVDMLMVTRREPSKSPGLAIHIERTGDRAAKKSAMPKKRGA